MKTENEHLFRKALERIGGQSRTAPWEHPWKHELEKPDNDTKGVPYHHIIQVRPDVERLIAQHKIDVRLSETVPGYNYWSDYVMIPRPSTFRSHDLWYQTLFHEMGHWTGQRVGRTRTMMIDHPMVNGCEEVIAELASAFLCEAFNVKGECHANYIDQYAREVPPSLMKSVMRQAVKAANYLLQKQ